MKFQHKIECCYCGEPLGHSSTDESDVKFLCVECKKDENEVTK